MSEEKTVKLMKNGKRLNRTMKKHPDKTLSKLLYNNSPKVNPSKMFSFSYLLKGIDTRKCMVKVEYSPVGFLDKDELDVKIKFVYVNNQLVDAGKAEIEEIYSAALNDYFIKHDAT